jgi:hypothetical protein
MTFDELARTIDDLKAALDLPVLTKADMPAPTTTVGERLREPRLSASEVRKRLGLDPAPTAPYPPTSARKRKAS